MIDKERRKKIWRGFLIALIFPITMLIIGIGIYKTVLRDAAIILIIVGITIFTILFFLTLENSTLFGQSTQENFDSLINEIESGVIPEEISTSKYNILLAIVQDPPEKAIGIITKLDLDDEAIALQCTTCESYFIPRYILDWLKTKNYCPVCKTIIKRWK
jgi:hypothetical protein